MAEAERQGKFEAWKVERTDEPLSDEPKSISLAAYQGVASEMEASTWIYGQAERLHATVETIIGAIRKGWTMVEIETLPRDEVEQLSDFVTKHKYGQGFIPGGEFNPAIEVE